MPLAEYTSNVVLNSPTANAAETVIAQVQNVSNYAAGTRVHVRGWANITPGATTSALTFRLRRGVDATGTLVGVASNEGAGFTVGQADDWTVEGQENPAEIAGASYVLTVQQTAGTAGATVNAVELTATVG